MGAAFTATTTVNDDIRVYAQWAYSYTVTFDKNGGDTEADPATKSVIEPAATIDALPTPPTRTDYAFTGWNTQPNGAGTAFTAATTVSSNITVYAQWVYSWTVSFDKNGGTTEANPPTKTVVSPATTIDSLPAPPTRPGGYTFTGWNTQPGGTGTAFDATTVVSASLTVYAQWRHEFNITVNLDAGDGAFSETDFTLSKSRTGYPNSQTIAITGTDYANPRWFVDGTPEGTGTSVTITAANYGAGGHTLTLFVNKSGVTWSKEITFTITN
jgi:uncharacterized repeat protein (TIGR02543 family)